MKLETFNRFCWVLIGIMLALIFLPAMSFPAETNIQLGWDAHFAGETVVGWQSVEVYVKVNDGEYDYDNPFAVVPQTYDEDGMSSPTQTEIIVLAVPDDTLTTFKFVARSKASVGGEIIASGDSNEVEVSYDTTALPDFEFAAAYNDTKESIDFTWAKADDRITSFKIFAGDTSGGPYTEIAEVLVGEDFQPSAEIAKGDLFPAGALTTKYFNMVAYAPAGVEIGSSTEIAITQDYREIANVMNFRLLLK